MAMFKTNELTEMQKLSRDAYLGKVENFSVSNAEQLIREKLIETVGGDWNYWQFQKNKPDFYALIQEIITINVSSQTVESFPWVEVKDYALGDAVEFYVTNTNLFKVANIATGTNTMRRQKMLDNKVPTKKYKLSIAIYNEFDKFIAGRINWFQLVEHVTKSFNTQLALDISRTVQGAYNSIHANLKYKGTYSDKDLGKIISKVKALVGPDVAIYGTSEAIENIQGANSLADLADRRAYGYVKEFRGTPIIELPQTYDYVNDAWGVRNDILYVVPANEKIVKCGFVGEAMIIETTDGRDRNDQQIEYKFQREVHLGVLATARFGAYIIE